MINQTVRNRYIALSDLRELLKRLFPANFQIEEKPDHYSLRLPRELNQVCLAFYSQPGADSAISVRDRFRDEETLISSVKGLALSLNKKHSWWEKTGIRMEELRRTIISAQHKKINTRGQSFIGNEDIREILKFDVVHTALHDENADDNCKLEIYHIGEVLDVVLTGAQKTFAILVHIRYVKVIPYIIAYDKCQSPELDCMLPLEKDSLKAIFDDQVFIDEFWERQWHYIAPVFSDTVLPRNFPRETIMPFLEDDAIQEGAFGIVHNVAIEPSHQCFSQKAFQQCKFVRKEMKPTNGYHTTYEIELRNLSILKLLRHPNTIQLISAYAYQGRLNLVFPRIQGCTLTQFLSSPRPDALESNASLLVALAGLCSGVRSVHHFTSSSHKLEMIGCHHDLKPDNVLVEGDKFLLIDFGLSRFKDSTELSNTPSKVIHAYYAAPECDSENGGIGRPVVHRSSDIWSLGCILAETVTYMLQGSEGVVQFAETRKFENDGIVLERFHQKGQAHPAVLTWLRTLLSSDSREAQAIGSLISDMLRINQQERPKAGETERRIYRIAFAAMCNPITLLFKNVCEKAISMEAELERTRFDGWTFACYFSNSGIEHLAAEWDMHSDTELIQRTLIRLPNELEIVLAQCQSPKTPIFQVLSRLNDLLFDDLSALGQDRAESYLTSHMMLHSSKELAAAPLEEDYVTNAQFRRLCLLATVKSMTRVMDKRPNNEWRIERGCLQNRKRVGDFKIQVLASDDTHAERSVLVESKTYREYYSDEATATELHIRLEEMTKVLRESDAAEGFRVLPCAGFYQDPPTFSFGLVYDFPRHLEDSSDQQVMTLRCALAQSRDRKDLEPSLEQKFKLAQNLVKSVFKFHTVSWLQKSISSYNIIFFHKHKRNWLDGIEDPFFAGYLHSRNKAIDAFTEGPTEDTHHRDYQHPEYRQKGLRFRAEYDYYSLGLVLLEIGLWKALDTIFDRLDQMDKAKDSTTPRIRRICQGCVPLLRLSMGSRYQEVVDTCLRGTFGVVDDKNEDVRHFQALERFKTLIVEQLGTISI